MEKLSLNKICSVLKLEEDKIVGCFVFGSHLWGTANKNSDFDFMIIMSVLPQETNKGFINIHNNQYDAYVLSIEKYIQNLERHFL